MLLNTRLSTAENHYIKFEVMANKNTKERSMELKLDQFYYSISASLLCAFIELVA